MTMAQAKALAKILSTERKSRGLSIRDLAARSGVQLATIYGIESRDILAPKPETLKQLAAALELSVSDLFTTAGWLPKDELPSFVPYMRAKYGELPEAGITELHAYIDSLVDKYDIKGPLDREDET